MFGVKGRYIASLTLNGYPFVHAHNLLSFKVVEEAGNTLPMFELVFKTNEERVLSYLNEGSTIQAMIGVDEDNMLKYVMKLKPMKKEVSRESGGEFNIIVRGLYDRIQYLTDTKVEISDKKSAIAVMKDKVSKHFTPEFDIGSSGDSQNWIQHNQSDKAMVQELWMRSDTGSDNFPMVGITADGRFRLRTVKAMLAGTPNWHFSIREGIPYASDYKIESDSGLMNYWQGYTKTSNVIDLDAGLADLFNSAITGGFSLSGTAERFAGVGQRVAESLLLNSNTHKKYHESNANNSANLAMFSSTRLTLTVPDIFFPIRVLDVARFSDDIDTSTGALESFSGIWCVSKVARNISGFKFSTTIVMCRESMNGVKGDLK